MKNNERKISKIVMEIIVKKVFVQEFTRKDLENYFNIKSTILLEGVKRYLSEEKFERVLCKIQENECNTSNEITEI